MWETRRSASECVAAREGAFGALVGGVIGDGEPHGLSACDRPAGNVTTLAPATRLQPPLAMRCESTAFKARLAVRLSHRDHRVENRVLGAFCGLCGSRELLSALELQLSYLYRYSHARRLCHTEWCDERQF